MKKEFIIAISSFVAIPVLFAASFIYSQINIYEYRMAGNRLAANTTLSTETSSTSATQDPTSTTSVTIQTTTNTSDTTPPIIKLIGLSPMYLKVGTIFIDPGALAYDNRDGDISLHIMSEHNVNTQTAGTYRVVYKVADKAGNISRAERIVVVIANTLNTTTESIQKISEPSLITSPTTENTTTQIPKIESTNTTTSSQTEINRILQIIQSENIERIEAEKRRILEAARLYKLENEETRALPRLAPAVEKRLAEKMEELRKRRPTTTPEIIQGKLQKIAERRDLVLDRVRTDRDRDGVSDYDEENLYNTDPQNPDTDGDGYSDGSEILGGYDPLDLDIQGRIAYEDPRERGERRAELFKVNVIQAREEFKSELEEKKAERLEFKGKGLPNSFVTLYIFSTPIVVTVRTDDEGNWEYVLDKELSDGSHELHVAMTDDTGKILAKGSPIPFIKEAQAITVDPGLLVPFAESNGTSLVWNTYMYATVLTILAVIGIVFTFIGMRATPYARRYKDDEPNSEGPDVNGNA